MLIKAPSSSVVAAVAISLATRCVGTVWAGGQLDSLLRDMDKSFTSSAACDGFKVAAVSWEIAGLSKKIKQPRAEAKQADRSKPLAVDTCAP
ncbi:unnamed protein product [Aphanomyces euteiches]